MCCINVSGDMMLSSVKFLKIENYLCHDDIHLNLKAPEIFMCLRSSLVSQACVGRGVRWVRPHPHPPPPHEPWPWKSANCEKENYQNK